MKTISYLILSLLAAVLFFTGCENESEQQTIISGVLTGNSDCKTEFKSTQGSLNVPDNLSCVAYSFNEAKGILTIKHINAGFNCCPESLYCSVNTIHDTIVISEFEKSALCYCNCLFDLDIEISGVEAEQYQIKVVEPYCGKQEEILFSIDLKNEANGSYCVPREQYPWNVISSMQ